MLNLKAIGGLALESENESWKVEEERQHRAQARSVCRCWPYWLGYVKRNGAVIMLLLYYIKLLLGKNVICCCVLHITFNFARHFPIPSFHQYHHLYTQHVFSERKIGGKNTYMIIFDVN